jgi:hypothetical protein
MNSLEMISLSEKILRREVLVVVELLEEQLQV